MRRIQKKLLRIRNNLELAKRDILHEMEWRLYGAGKFYARHYRELASATRWCFIVGCNNSGTTLLQRLLEASGDVSTLPYEGQMYTRVLRRAKKKGYERVWTEYMEELVVDRNADKQCAARLYYDWMTDLQYPLKSMIVEKTPANALRMGWLETVFPNSYFIGLVRNGYAVSEGIMRKGNKSAERAARHWETVNKIMIDESDKVKRFMLMKYEDIVNDPKAMANKLSKYLSLDKNRMLSAVNKNFMREGEWGVSSAKPMENMNEKSIKRLGRDEIDVITRNAGSMLNYLGYSEPQ